jgi:hypothetical protein
MRVVAPPKGRLSESRAPSKYWLLGLVVVLVVLLVVPAITRSPSLPPADVLYRHDEQLPVNALCGRGLVAVLGSSDGGSQQAVWLQPGEQGFDGRLVYRGELGVMVKPCGSDLLTADANGLGCWRLTGAGQLERIWYHERASFGSPAQIAATAAGAVVVFRQAGDAAPYDRLVSFSHDGAKRWALALPAGDAVTAIANPGRLTVVGTYNPWQKRSALFGIDENGTPQWCLEAGSQPVISLTGPDHGESFFAGLGHGLWSLSFSGETLWSYDGPGPCLFVAADPQGRFVAAAFLVSRPGLPFLPRSETMIVCFDAHGRRLWEHDSQKPLLGMAWLEAPPQLVLAYEKEIAARGLSGAILWRAAVSEPVSAFDIAGQQVLVGTIQGAICGYQP